MLFAGVFLLLKFSRLTLIKLLWNVWLSGTKFEGDERVQIQIDIAADDQWPEYGIVKSGENIQQLHLAVVGCLVWVIDAQCDIAGQPSPDAGGHRINIHRAVGGDAKIEIDVGIVADVKTIKQGGGIGRAVLDAVGKINDPLRVIAGVDFALISNALSPLPSRFPCRSIANGQ